MLLLSKAFSPPAFVATYVLAGCAGASASIVAAFHFHAPLEAREATAKYWSEGPAVWEHEFNRYCHRRSKRLALGFLDETDLRGKPEEYWRLSGPWKVYSNWVQESSRSALGGSAGTMALLTAGWLHTFRVVLLHRRQMAPRQVLFAATLGMVAAAQPVWETATLAVQLMRPRTATDVPDVADSQMAEPDLAAHVAGNLFGAVAYAALCRRAPAKLL